MSEAAAGGALVASTSIDSAPAAMTAAGPPAAATTPPAVKSRRERRVPAWQLVMDRLGKAALRGPGARWTGARQRWEGERADTQARSIGSGVTTRAASALTQRNTVPDHACNDGVC